MSNFDMLYKQYDYNKSFSPSSNTNYFEKDIKEGLSFFQQNKLQSTLRNNYFNSNNDSNIKMTSSEKNDKINLEAKKIIEREIEPYLSLMKKELNLIVEKYSKDFQKKNDTINELLNLKNDLEEIKKENANNNNILAQKLMKNNENMNEIEQKINNINSDINKFNQLFNIQLDNSSLIPNLNNDIDKLKQNLTLQETNMKTLFSEQKTNTEQTILQKYNECMNKINNMKEENDLLKNKIEELNNTIRIMKSNDIEKNEEQMNQINSNIELKKLLNQYKLELDNKDNKIKNLEDFSENNKKKIEQLNKNIETAFSNINTEHLSIIKLATELKNILNNIQKCEETIDNSIYKKDVIDFKLENINEQIEAQNEKMKEVSIKSNETINERNNKLSFDLTKKFEEYKKYFENHYDAIDGTIISLNNKISEISTTMQTHPLLNMNNNEIITLKFKENQIKFNDIIKKAIEEIKSQIGKLNYNLKIDEINKNNFILFKQNLDKINDEIKKVQTYPELISKIKEELNNKINILEQEKNNTEKNINTDLEPINILKKEINRLSKDIKNIKEEKIPEILILIENIRNIENSGNNIRNENPEEEINVGNRRKKQDNFAKTWSRRNNTNSILDTINTNNNYNTNNFNNNINNFEENNNNNIINNVKKFMENNNKINIENIQEENISNNNINNINNPNMSNNNNFNNNIPNKDLNEDDYADFDYNFNEEKNQEQNRSNNFNINNNNFNNQSNSFGLNNSNQFNSKDKDETNELIDNIINNNNSKNNQSLNKEKIEDNFDDDFDS